MVRRLAIAATALGMLGLMAFAQPAHAQPYGAAGCGLGSMLFGAKPGLVQVLAATTNGTFWSQTFGISTGTSNCAGGGTKLVSAKAFVETNREAIAKDISRGSGETIKGLTSLAGCRDAKKVGATLQREFNSIFPNEKVSDTTVSSAVIRTLKHDRALQCANLS